MIHHKPTLSWSPHDRVKRQINIGSFVKTAGSKERERADLLAKDRSGSNTRQAIIKSLITVSFILCLELVVYLVRSKYP